MNEDDEIDALLESRVLETRMTWKEAPWLAFDFEATGTDPRKDRPIQFGWARQERRGGPIETGECWINPQMEIASAGFLKLSPDELEAIRIAPTFGEHVPYWMHLMQSDAVLMGWNCGNRFKSDGPGYDCPMFAAECARVGWYDLRRPVIDCMTVACQTATPRPAKWQLGAIAEHFGITFPAQAHRAGADSFVTLSAMERMATALPDDLHEVHALVDRWIGLSWWLREMGDRYELNCGKYLGMNLEEVAALLDRRGQPAGYLRWALELPDLPEATGALFRSALKGKK